MWFYLINKVFDSVRIEIFNSLSHKISLKFRIFCIKNIIMSNGIPSQISLDNAVVAQDEMGRPFIIVRE